MADQNRTHHNRRFITPITAQQYLHLKEEIEPKDDMFKSDKCPMSRACPEHVQSSSIFKVSYRLSLNAQLEQYNYFVQIREKVDSKTKTEEAKANNTPNVSHNLAHTAKRIQSADDLSKNLSR